MSSWVHCSNQKELRGLRSFLTSIFILLTVALHETAAWAQDVSIVESPPREIIAAMPRSWPPQFSVDDQGNPTGFAIDVMEEIASRAGIRLTYRVFDSFAEVSEAMRRGEAHIIPNSGVTPERKRDYLFTEPVEAVPVSVFVREDTTKIQGIEDLTGRKVGVVEHNVSQKLVVDRPDIVSIVHRDAVTALFALLSGQTDALIFPAPVMVRLIRQAGVENKVRIVGQPLLEIKRAIRVQKSEPALFAALNAVVKDFVGTPTYRKIYIKWYSKPMPVWTAQRVGWSMGAIIVVIVLMFIMWRYRVGVEMIRETKAREERFRDFAELGADWFWETDENLRFVYLSSNVTQLGVGPDFFIGKSAAEIHHENAAGLALGANLIAQKSRTPYRDIEHRTAANPGMWVRSTGKPIFSEHGEFMGYRGATTNITENKRAEKARQIALKEAEQANQTKSKFLATISHEFRTPLNAIIGFSQIMREQTFGPIGMNKYQEYAKDIHDSGEQMLGLINDILDISAIEAGKRSLRKEDIDLGHLLHECLRNFELRARDKRIEMTLRVSNEFPPLFADRRSMVQIIQNLLSNAIKFTPRNGRIEVSAANTGSQMHLAVRDFGIGMAPEHLPRIIAPFYQIHTDPLVARTGTGLGLSIVKELVEAHEADLKIESELGAGTVVTVTFGSNGTEADRPTLRRASNIFSAYGGYKVSHTDQ
jgi:PAS domain S-box-containing protein